MKTQDGLARKFVGRQNQEHPVQSSRPPQSRIYIPGMIGGGQHKDAFIVVTRRVEFGQELINDTADCRMSHQAALAAQRVDLVKEKHARRSLSRALKYLMQVSFAVSHPHVQDIR